MRTPIFRVVNDDDPSDYWTPRAMTLQGFTDAGDDETYDACKPLNVGDSITVGGGAGTQFTLTRIR